MIYQAPCASGHKKPPVEPFWLTPGLQAIGDESNTPRAFIDFVGTLPNGKLHHIFAEFTGADAALGDAVSELVSSLDALKRSYQYEVKSPSKPILRFLDQLPYQLYCRVGENFFPELLSQNKRLL